MQFYTEVGKINYFFHCDRGNIQTEVATYSQLGGSDEFLVVLPDGGVLTFLNPTQYRGRSGNIYTEPDPNRVVHKVIKQ